MLAMSVDIYLIRHAEASARWGEDPDPGLSTQGRRQARQVRDKLETSANLKTVSSPFLRARETALALANVQREPMVIDETYREIPSPAGITDRQSWLRKLMKQNWEEQDPEILLWRNTIWLSLFEIECHIAIFTHFMAINSGVSRLTGAPETVCFVPDHGSITRLRLDSHSLELVKLGHQHKTLVS